jgi:hypothetical protein
VNYSQDPEELLRQLMPAHSQITLKARYWNPEEDYVKFFLMRGEEQIDWSFGHAVLYMRKADTRVSLDWAGAKGAPGLQNAVEKSVLAAADEVVASYSFTLVLKEYKGYAFTLTSNTGSVPVGLDFPNAFLGYWHTFLPRGSKELHAYSAALELKRAQEAAKTAKPAVSPVEEFKKAIAALAA